MSRDYHCYVGPYVRCQPKMTTRQSFKPVCPTPGCPAFLQIVRGAFCSDCGQPFSSRVQEFLAAVQEEDEVCEATGGVFAYVPDLPIGSHVFVANVAGSATRNYRLDPCSDEIVMPVSLELMVEEVKRFVDDFPGAMDVLRDAYGSDGFQVLWGVLLYSS